MYKSLNNNLPQRLSLTGEIPSKTFLPPPPALASVYLPSFLHELKMSLQSLLPHLRPNSNPSITNL